MYDETENTRHAKGKMSGLHSRGLVQHRCSGWRKVDMRREKLVDWQSVRSLGVTASHDNDDSSEAMAHQDLKFLIFPFSFYFWYFKFSNFMHQNKHMKFVKVFYLLENVFLGFFKFSFYCHYQIIFIFPYLKISFFKHQIFQFLF